MRQMVPIETMPFNRDHCGHTELPPALHSTPTQTYLAWRQDPLLFTWCEVKRVPLLALHQPKHDHRPVHLPSRDHAPGADPSHAMP